VNVVITQSQINQIVDTIVKNVKPDKLHSLLKLSTKARFYMDKKQLLISEWVTKAEHDLGMAKLAIDHKPEYIDLICFHCQQAAEKYLKSYMIYRDLSF
jgi:hypothetical protein